MPTTELSAETRARILDSAWARVRDHGAGAVSVKAIAEAAGVSRQLVYFHYGSRAGLLDAMARHHDENSGFARQVASTDSLPPVEALEALLRAWCGYLPEVLPGARALEAALVTGDEGGEVWRDRMQELWQIFRRAVGRVDAAGRLAPEWDPDRAADWIWARVQPSVFAHLVEERGWAPARFADSVVRSVMDELVTP